MIFDKDRFDGVSDKTKMIMLEAENDAMEAMLTEALDNLAKIDCAVQNLRQALHLGLDETEQTVDQK